MNASEKEMITIHQVPGRIRFCSNLLRKQQEDGWQFLETLSLIPGVEKIKLNPRTSSLTIHFDQEILTPFRLYQHINKLDIFSGVTILPRNHDATMTRASASRKEFVSEIASTTAKTFLRTVIEHTATYTAKVLIRKIF